MGEMMMSMSDMTKALQVYIRKFKIYGADIKYDRSEVSIKGYIELSDDQLFFFTSASTAPASPTTECC